MKTRLVLLALCLCATAVPAQAACYADYKAKQDGPLRLHYGVMQLGGGGCPDQRAAASQVAARLERAGWTLLNIVRLSSDAPSAQQKANAGDFFLRF